MLACLTGFMFFMRHICNNRIMARCVSSTHFGIEHAFGSSFVLVLALVLLLAQALLGLCPLQAQAQALTYDTQRAKIEQIKQTLKDIDAALVREQTDANLAKLRAQTEVLGQSTSQLVAALEPDVQTLKSRLEQIRKSKQTLSEALSPSSGAGTAAGADESTKAITGADDSDQLALEKKLGEVTALLALANDSALGVEKTGRVIAEKRRAIFAHETFAYTAGLLSPVLWANLLREFPGDVAALSTVGNDFVTMAGHDVFAWITVCAVYAFGLLLAFFAPIRKIVTAILTSPAATALAQHIGLELTEPATDSVQETPNFLARVTASLLVFILGIAMPLVCLATVLLLAASLDLGAPRLAPLSRAIVSAFIIMTTAQALSHALLVSRAKAWQIFDIAPKLLLELQNAITSLTFVFILGHLADALGEVIVASVNFSALVRSLAALSIAFLLMRCLSKISAFRAADETKTASASKAGLNKSQDDRATSVIVQEQDDASKSIKKEPVRRGIYPVVRLFYWGLAFCIAGACLSGYVAFASFLTVQLFWVSGVCGVLYLLLKLSHELCRTCLDPAGKLGGELAMLLGLRSDSLRPLTTLADGLLNVTLYGLAFLLLLAPWGVQSDDMFTAFNAVVFGFKFGDVTVSLAAIITALFIFLLSILVTKALQKWLGVKFLPLTGLDAGLSNSITTSLGYVGFVLALSLSFTYLGLSFDRLAIVAGALSVGIGFGLQSIVSNFVSGLILLWERAIRVGDWVVVGEEQGIVRRISVRATEIDTFDRASVIVPNSNLVSGIVKNWMRTDKSGRIKIDINLGYDADAAAARALLLGAAKGHREVLTIPAPQVFLTALNEFAMHFEIYCFVEDVETVQKVKSDLHFEILRRLKEKNMRIPIPHQKIDVVWPNQLTENRPETGEILHATAEASLNPLRPAAGALSPGKAD